MVGAILGVCPYMTPMQAWARLHGLVPDLRDDDALRRGRLLEPGLILEAGRILGAEPLPCPPHDEPGYPIGGFRWAHAHPDARAIVPGEGVIAVETKSARDLDAWDAPPPHYLLQLIWEMASTPPEGAFAGAILVAGDPLTGQVRSWRYPRDIARERRLIRRVRAWWVAHVRNARPPADNSALPYRVATQDRGDWSELTPEVSAAAERLRLARDARDAAAEEYRAASTELLRLAPEGSRGWAGVARVVRKQGTTTIDAPGLRAAHPEIAAQFERRSLPTAHVEIINAKEKK